MGVTSVVRFRCICDKCKKEKYLDSQPITIKRRSDAAPEYYCEKCLPEVLGIRNDIETKYRIVWEMIEVYNDGNTIITSKSNAEMLNIFQNGGELLSELKSSEWNTMSFNIYPEEPIHKEFKKKFESIKYRCFGNIVLVNPSSISKLKKIILIKHLEYKGFGECKEKRYGE